MIALNARGAVGVGPVGAAADRVAEDLDRRLRDVLVEVRRARLAEVLQLSGRVITCLDARPRPGAGELAEPLEAGVRPRPTTSTTVGPGTTRHSGTSPRSLRDATRARRVHPSLPGGPVGAWRVLSQRASWLGPFGRFGRFLRGRGLGPQRGPRVIAGGCQGIARHAGGTLRTKTVQTVQT